MASPDAISEMPTIETRNVTEAIQPPVMKKNVEERGVTNMYWSEDMLAKFLAALVLNDPAQAQQARHAAGRGPLHHHRGGDDQEDQGAAGAERRGTHHGGEALLGSVDGGDLGVDRVSALASRFRTCPTTGLSVDRTADNLIKAHAVVATVSLLVGGIAALLVLLLLGTALGADRPRVTRTVLDEALAKGRDGRMGVARLGRRRGKRPEPGGADARRRQRRCPDPPGDGPAEAPPPVER